MKKELEIVGRQTLFDKEVAIYGTLENPLFALKEVKSWIGVKNSTDLSKKLDEDERVRLNLNRGGNEWFVTEDGLYEILMQSRKPIAKEFKKGIKRILKEIRTKGGYIAERADDTPEDIMARALKVADATLKRREERIRELESHNDELLLVATKQQQHIAKLTPAANYAEEVLLSNDAYTSTQMAKELGMTSAIALHRELQKKGVMFQQSSSWMLTADYSTKGYTKTRTFTYVKGIGEVGTKTITVWTETGRVFLNKMFNRYNSTTL